ncbi:dienelactone hydrolase family protein [Clavibacter sp. CFBP 8614]|uniref:dienelactone hydrolase family protein n=1 Tax=unclassified Clavibacter TaxID=2626594 RepID=UPI004041D7D3
MLAHRRARHARLEGRPRAHGRVPRGLHRPDRLALTGAGRACTACWRSPTARAPGPRSWWFTGPSACPIVASYGGRDRQLAGSADRLAAALVAHGIDHDVREHPDAGHAFLDDAEPGPRILRPVLRALGMGTEPASAAHAWRRIDAFLDAHLRGGERAGA